MSNNNDVVLTCECCGRRFASWLYEDDSGDAVLCGYCANPSDPTGPNGPYGDPSPHYRKLEIEPIDFIKANSLDFFQGNIIKYVCRYKYKDGMKDLKKALDYLERLIKNEEEKAEDAERDYR